MPDITINDSTRIEQLMEHRVKYHFEGILLRGMPTLLALRNKNQSSLFQQILQRIYQHPKV